MLVGIWTRRLIYLAVALSVVALGLSLRRYNEILPDLFGLYVGDALWALMVFLGIGVFIPNRSTFQRGLIAITFAYAIELSQFTMRRGSIHCVARPWRARAWFCVLWTDFVCYAAGVIVGMLADRWAWSKAIGSPPLDRSSR